MKAGWKTPDDWNWVVLGDHAEIIFSSVDKKSAVDEKRVKLCNYTDVYYRDHIDSADGLMDGSATADEINKFSLRRGDVLVTKDSETSDDIGVPALVTKDLPDVLCGYHLAIIRPNIERLHSAFVSHVFQSHYLRKQLFRESNGVTRFGLGLDSMRGLKLLVPDTTEQVKIVDILALWNGTVTKLTSLLTVKVEQKHGLMQQLLTGQTRFKEFVKSDKKLVTHFGPFPADWSVVYFGDIADEIGEKNGDGKDLPVLSCTKYRGLVNSLEYFGRRMFSEDTSTYKVVRRGDFAYATNHIEEGSIGYQNLHDVALISPMYTVFRPRDGVDHSFLFKLVKTELYRHIFEANTNGTINRRGALRWEEFSHIKVHLPSEPEQRRIAAVLETCDAEIGLLQKQLDALKEQRRGLMQKLLTGKVRVKVK